MELPLLSIIVTIIIAVSGWVVGHALNTKRDQANKRREIRLQRLLDIYDSLAKDIAHRNMGKNEKTQFENALSELQLIGTDELIDLASNFKVDDENRGSIIPILTVLRTEIRNELGLAKTNLPFMWFRFSKQGRWERKDK